MHTLFLVSVLTSILSLFAGDLWRVQADVDGQAHQPAQADTRRAQAGGAKDGALTSRVDDMSEWCLLCELSRSIDFVVPNLSHLHTKTALLHTRALTIALEP